MLYILQGSYLSAVVGLKSRLVQEQCWELVQVCTVFARFVCESQNNGVHSGPARLINQVTGKLRLL